MSKVLVLFEVKPTQEGMKRYLELAAMLNRCWPASRASCGQSAFPVSTSRASC